MKLEDVLKNNSDTPLSKEEIEILKREQYILDSSTPSRVVNNKSYMEWVSKKYPREVSDYLLSKDSVRINDYNYSAFACNEELLEKSLSYNYEYTLSCLIKHGCKLSVNNNIKSILKNKGFVINNNMAYFAHQNPWLINVSLNNNYEDTLDFLKQHLNIPISSEDREEFREILKRHNFVIDINSIEVACAYHDLIKVSLEKDAIETLYVRAYQILKAIKDNDELYIECLIRLEEIFTNPHSEEEKKKIIEMLGVFNIEPELFFSCLENKHAYKNFLNNIEGSYIRVLLSDNDSKRLYELLKDTNFKLSNYPRVANINFNFVLASLSNDFDGTARVLKEAFDRGDMEYIEQFTSHEISDEEYARYKEVILNHDILNVDSFVMYADYRALRVLSEIDVNMAAIMLGVRYDEETFLDIPSHYAMEILKNILLKKNELDKSNFFEDTYFRLRNLILDIPRNRYSNEFKEGDIDLILDAFKDGTLAMSMLSSNYLTRQDILDKLNVNHHTRVLLEKTTFKRYLYEQKDEQYLLKIMKKEESLEDVIVSLQHKKRSELTLEEMLAIKMYALKVLNKNGVGDYSVEVFDYSKDKDTYGCENREHKRVSLYNGHDRSVYDMIKTLHHEINHAIQFKNIEEANFDDDPDINYYAKDEILRDILGEDYYKSNYDWVSFEFDTEFKAKLLTDALFGLDNPNKSLDEKMAQLEKIESSLKYSHSIKRVDKDKKSMNLDDFFIKIIDKDYIDLIGLDSFKKKYKSLTYEYKIDENGIRKYSVEELSLLMNNANEDDKKRYLIVMKNQLNPSRNKEWEKNINVLEGLYLKGTIGEDILIELGISSIGEVKKECYRYLGYLDSHFDRIEKSFSKKKNNNKK